MPNMHGIQYLIALLLFLSGSGDTGIRDRLVVGINYSTGSLLEPPPAKGRGRIPPLTLFPETGRAVLPRLLENPRGGFGNTGPVFKVALLASRTVTVNRQLNTYTKGSGS